MNLTKQPARLRLPLVGALLLLTTACAQVPGNQGSGPGLNHDLVTRAVYVANEMRAAGKKVWCVPFARNASGIEIRGNAGTWWAQAKDRFRRDKTPAEGAVMAFRSTKSLPLGHVAVVSEVISEREIRIDHANWHPSQVSLRMPVIDVSPDNDWSQVRVQSYPDSFGKVYAIDGFILHWPEDE